MFSYIQETLQVEIKTVALKEKFKFLLQFLING